MISRPCDQCGQVKRCRMRRDAEGRIGYVCRPCARELGDHVTATVDDDQAPPTPPTPRRPAEQLALLTLPPAPSSLQHVTGRLPHPIAWRVVTRCLDCPLSDVQTVRARSAEAATRSVRLRLTPQGEAPTHRWVSAAG